MAEINGIEFGPLAGLVGTWEGDKGMDVSPNKTEGTEDNPYFETITFEVVGDVTNAGKQTLAVIRYHQVVSRKADNQIFHDEIGYWMWDDASKTVAHSLAIPRAVAVLAGGKYDGAGTGGGVEISVAAKLGDPDWGIVQSPFMRDNASTVEFRHNVKINGNKLSYLETTVLEIYGKTFDHTDENELIKV